MAAPRDIAAHLAAIPGRTAGTDAERRAALALARELRARGREARIETHWVRPQWAPAAALHALAGVVGSLVSVDRPVLGLLIAAAALVSFLAEASGRARLLGLLLPRRATQNVVSPAPAGARPVTLVITASYDAGRGGLVYRDAVRRLAARLARAARGRAPGPMGWLALALAAVVAGAALRAGGAEGPVLGAVQLVPTIALILATALLVDAHVAAPSPGASDPASGAAVALALAQALDARPPRRLAVEVVLCGAGDGGAYGMRAHVRAARRTRRTEEVVVLHLGACGAGTPRWWVREGPLLALGYHPRLLELCAQVTREEAHLRAAPHVAHTFSGAHAARLARWPAVAVGCLDADGVAGPPDERARRAVLELCLALIARLDAELAGADG